MSSALKVNTGLITLIIGFNATGPDGARHLSDALKLNTTLLTLNIVDAEIGSAGGDYLLEVLKVNTAPTHLGVDRKDTADADTLEALEALEALEVMEVMEVRQVRIAMKYYPYRDSDPLLSCNLFTETFFEITRFLGRNRAQLPQLEEACLGLELNSGLQYPSDIMPLIVQQFLTLPIAVREAALTTVQELSAAAGARPKTA